MHTTIQLSPVIANWDIGTFLKNSNTTIGTWGGYAVSLLGLILIIVGVYKLVKGLMQHEKGQANWFIILAMFIVGGALVAGSLKFVQSIAGGGRKTLTDLGDGTGSATGSATGTASAMILPELQGIYLSLHDAVATVIPTLHSSMHPFGI